MQQPMTIIKDSANLTGEEVLALKKRITVAPAKHAPAGNGGSNIPMHVLYCTDGKEFAPQYEEQAIAHENHIWIMEQLVAKYQQHTAQKEFWRIISHGIGCQGEFTGCYFINIPDNSLNTFKEIEHMHPKTKQTGVWLASIIQQHGPGWYIISYGIIDKYGLHPLDAEEVVITPTNHVLSKMAQLQLTLQDLNEHGKR